MYIKSVKIENFTILGKNKLHFSKGLNIIIGENDTGKSHLLRLLYAVIESNKDEHLEQSDRFMDKNSYENS